MMMVLTSIRLSFARVSSRSTLEIENNLTSRSILRPEGGVQMIGIPLRKCAPTEDVARQPNNGGGPRTHTLDSNLWVCMPWAAAHGFRQAVPQLFFGLGGVALIIFAAVQFQVKTYPPSALVAPGQAKSADRIPKRQVGALHFRSSADRDQRQGRERKAV